MNGEFAKGKRIKVACECWFTSEGKMTKLMVKVKDEDGEIRAFRNLVVLAQEKLFGGCSPSTEFLCRITVLGQEREVVLRYMHNDCIWEMILP